MVSIQKIKLETDKKEGSFDPSKMHSPYFVAANDRSTGQEPEDYYHHGDHEQNVYQTAQAAKKESN
jgi:hypothetical protein